MALSKPHERKNAMYRSHYGLSRKPFDISPNPDFLWLGEKHREGLAVLKYGILENKGFLMITGEVGTGKTALIRAVQREVQARIIVASIPDPGLSLIDFYNILGSELNMDRSFASKGEFLVHFKRFILSTASAERRVLLIIDEAQRLSSELLEEIRLLSNIDLDGQVVINTFFVGQNEFKALLERPENQAVRQRITVSYELGPLNEGELRQYVEHRLKVAGAKRGIFSVAALGLVHRYSRGYPRLVNIICDHALMTGYGRGVEGIDEGIIAECGDELKVAMGLRPRKEAPLPLPAAAPRVVVPAAVAACAPRGPWRSAAMAAVVLVLAVGGWYLAGDRITGALGRRVESREAPAAGGADGRAALRQNETPPRAPSPPPAGAVDPEPAKAETAALSAAESPAGPALAAPVRVDREDPPRNPAAGGPAVAALPAAPAPKPEVAAPAHPRPPRTSPPAAPKGASARSPAPPPSDRMKEFVIYFPRGSTALSNRAAGPVEEAAALLDRLPGTRARIEGYADSAGDPVSNKAVAEGRAASVKNRLEGRGIDPRRLDVISPGAGTSLEPKAGAAPGGSSRVVIRVLLETPPL